MHDVIIIGAGPAGLSAAWWCDELGLDTLVLEQHDQIGGQLHSIYGPIKNYPGVRASDGESFLARYCSGNDDADFDLWTGVEIERVDLKARKVWLRSGEELQSIAIILATGVRRRRLGIPGELEFEGHGIIESPTRDRENFAGRDVCVVGGGDAAAENALLLAKSCPTVTVVHRSKKLRARREFAAHVRNLALIARELFGLPLRVVDVLLCALGLPLFELALRLPQPVCCRLRLGLRLRIASRCTAKGISRFACGPRGLANLGPLLFA